MRRLLAAACLSLLVLSAAAEPRGRGRGAEDSGRLADEAETYAGKAVKCPKGFRPVPKEGPGLKLPEEPRRRRRRSPGEDGPPLVYGKARKAGASTRLRCVPDAGTAAKKGQPAEAALDPINPAEDPGAAVPQLPLPPP